MRKKRKEQPNTSFTVSTKASTGRRPGRSERWSLGPQTKSPGLPINWGLSIRLGPSESGRKAQAPHTFQTLGPVPLEAFLVNREKEKTNTPNPLIQTLQAPPLPLAEAPHQPLPTPVSLTPSTLWPALSPRVWRLLIIAGGRLPPAVPD